MTGEENLTKEKLIKYGTSKPFINKQVQYNVIRQVYKKTYNELLAMSNEQLSQYNELVDYTNFKTSFSKMHGHMLSVGIADIKSNKGRQYSGWKLILNATYLTPRHNAAEEAIDECEELLRTTQVIQQDDEIED